MQKTVAMQVRHALANEADAKPRRIEAESARRAALLDHPKQWIWNVLQHRDANPRGVEVVTHLHDIRVLPCTPQAEDLCRRHAVMSSPLALDFDGDLLRLIQVLGLKQLAIRALAQPLEQ